MTGRLAESLVENCPCDSCGNKRQCVTNEIACHEFRLWTREKGLTSSERKRLSLVKVSERIPDKKTWDMIYG